MHLVKDENGNLISHGHAHEHDTSGGCKGHCDSCGSDCEHDHKKESLALLTYMLQHNEHHAAELDQMADNLVKLGLDEAAKQIKEGVSDFQKGNMRLSLALALMKEQMKED